eukprot:4270369-Prymnesium_polylepis.3
MRSHACRGDGRPDLDPHSARHAQRARHVWEGDLSVTRDVIRTLERVGAGGFRLPSDTRRVAAGLLS